MAICTNPPIARSPEQKIARRGISRFLADPGEMTLKVSGSAKEEARLVQIKSAKCTVGSAVGCTLRVRGAGVGPLACWILRGPAGVVVRRLHGPVTLNGGQFEESALKNGDRLRIGGVELELVDCSQPSRQPLPLLPLPPSVDTTALETRLAEALATIQRLEVESRQGFQSSIVAADRADQLRNALAAAHQQLEDTCRDLTAAQETIVVQSGTIEAQKREIETIKCEVGRLGEGKTASLVEEARRETAAAVKQCAATGTELAQVRNEMAREQVRWDDERRQYELRLEQRAAEIEALRNAAAGQEGAMTVVFGRDGKSSGERDDLAAKVKTLEEQIAAKDGEIQSLRLVEADQTAVKGKLESLQCEFESKCDELKVAQDWLTATEQQLAASTEFDARAQSLAQQEEVLVEREKSVGAAERRIDEEKAALGTRSDQLTSQAEQISADRQNLAQELDQAAQARQQIEIDRNQLEQDRVQFEKDRAQIEQNRMQVTECEAKQEALDERELQLESQAAELAEQVAAASARTIELDAHREQLAAERASLDERGLSLQRQQGELDARAAELEAKAAELSSQRDELNAQAAALRQAPQTNEAASHEGAGETPEALRVEPSREAPADGSRPQSVVVTSAWQSPESLPDENRENVIDHSAPMEGSGENENESANVDSVLSRLVKSGLWRGNVAADAGSETGEAASEGPVSQTMILNEPIAEPAASVAHPSRPAQAKSDDEESIESYMDRLMKRVRGDSTPMASRVSPTVQPVEEAAPESGATPEAAAPEPPDQAEEAGEYSPRRPAPELSNMSAMRELANSAARSAIDKHVRKHTGKQVTGKLFGACLTVGTSLLLGFWAWRGQSSPAAVGAAIGGCIGLYWTWAAVRRLFSLMRLNRPQEEQPAAENAAGEDSIPA